MSGVSRRSVLDDRADRPLTARLEAILGRTLRILVCGVATFALTFIEQVAEILAPLFLIAGIAWWVLVNLTANLHLDPMLQSVVTQLPHSLSLGGHYLTPEGLIRNGVLLVAVVAVCRTLNGIIAKET